MTRRISAQRRVHVLGRAEQEDAETVLLRGPGRVVDEIGGGAALRDGRARQQARGKYHRLAVGVNEIGGLE